MIGAALAFGPDDAAALQRSLDAYDAAAHERLVADAAEASRLAEEAALDLAPTEAGAALVLRALRAIDAAGLAHTYRVIEVKAAPAVVLRRRGDAKRPGAAEVRDGVLAALRGAGLRAELFGSWDIDVTEGNHAE